MRTLATLALIAATFSVAQDAGAQGRYYPWCARYDAYTTNCGFVTFQQCLATISGMGGICQENVMSPPHVEASRGTKRKHRRQH